MRCGHCGTPVEKRYRVCRGCGAYYRRHRPALFTTRSTAAPPVPASAAFRSVAHPHRTGEYASGALGRKTPHLQDLTTPRDERVENKAGKKRIGAGLMAFLFTPLFPPEPLIGITSNLLGMRKKWFRANA